MGAFLHDHLNDLIGSVGLWLFHEPPVDELSYALDTRYWRRGYASPRAEP
jgi:RimJ/RimL family protein N-acetyltransferase